MSDDSHCLSALNRPPNRTLKTPWGSFAAWDLGELHGISSWIKTIKVEPREMLSLQRHTFRTECWTCISGVGVACIDQDQIPFTSGEETILIIRPGIWHRAINTSHTSPLIFIEHAWGQRLSENDIERREDKYGRV